MTEPMPIKPIRDDVDHAAALEEIVRLFGAAPGTPEADRLEVLGVLTADYERRTHPVSAPDPIDVITFAMKTQGRSQADLAATIGSRSRASEVLSRKRRLSAGMIARISKAWSIPADLLSTPYPVEARLGGIAARGAAAAMIVIALASAGVGGLFWRHGQGLPSAADIARHTPVDVTRRDETGKLVEHRRFVPLEQIPPHVVKAFLAAEDQDFYAHSGYSVGAIFRAFVGNLADIGSGRKPAGAATITQQLAKNMFLRGQKPSIERKVKEIILARRIEAAASKDRILELYLNEIYFGGAAYGIGAAADLYFGRRASELTVAEAAYLAALPKAPNNYRFDVAANRARAKERRDWVLDRMAQDGLITVSAARFAQAEPLGSGASRAN